MAADLQVSENQISLTVNQFLDGPTLSDQPSRRLEEAIIVVTTSVTSQTSLEVSSVVQNVASISVIELSIDLGGLVSSVAAPIVRC